MTFSIYCAEKGVVCSLVFVKVLVGCVIVVQASSVFLEHDHFAIAKVYVDEWVQFCVDHYPELGCHCGKGDYV